MNEYFPTRCTPWHMLGGMFVALLTGVIGAGIFFAGTIYIYQLYDSLPRECLAWDHTKWDILESGVGSMITGCALMILEYI